ncbi:MAG TPA: ATP-dependent helicase HrpB [Bacteroidetes bacterium]|nr:ATP-dependent helicase HrpB [Bacteroidota bacterium]
MSTHSFDPFSIDLPIRDAIDELRTTLSNESVAIVHAPPGAGKSTLLPLALMDEGFIGGQKILMLEPRRLAAKTIAMRMSELLGHQTGTTVGYRVRFEQKISEDSRIEVLTEGILTRRLQRDPELEGVGLVIFDEFHERSIHADLALALCREAQKVLRPDLRILIMSATLNIKELSSLLKAPVISSLGRQYPVDVRYGDGVDMRLISEIMSRKVVQAAKEEEGDILVFLPGEAEIRRCEADLKRMLPGIEIHPLYGMLPPARQMAAIYPSKKGNRKVVLATSIAETSLTIEGVKIVVDSGLGRKSKFDPRSGLSRLETVIISTGSADQRAGRAGRLAPGVCYRMWTLADHSRMQKHDVPEILEADLSSLLLELAQWGVNDPAQLDWLNPPPSGHVKQARATLEELGAVESGKITEHGKKMLELPCHPRLAHMLLLAGSETNKKLACDVAAVLEERDPLPRDSGIDITLRIEALRRFRQTKNDAARMGRIEKVAESYLRIFDLAADNGPVDAYECGLLIAHAFPERIASSRPGNNSQFQLANGRYAQAGPKDDLGHEPWLAVAHLDARDGLGKIFMAAPLNPKDLAPMVKQEKVITWDTRKGGLIASMDLRIGSIILQSKPLPEPDAQHLNDAICKALRSEGQNLLNWDEATTQWQNRVMSMRKWQPAEGWPEVSTEALLLVVEDWIAPYLAGVKKPEDLKKIKLAEILPYTLSYEQQQKLDEFAPASLKVPSGSLIQIQYQANGDAPILSVRLQQVFGLAETPRINGGEIPVVMELLSPANRPVQTTRDLKNFWDSTYFEVKKELKRRYPKHSWPDDPWTAPALKGVRR